MDKSAWLGGLKSNANLDVLLSDGLWYPIIPGSLKLKPDGILFKSELEVGDFGATETHWYHVRYDAIFGVRAQ